MISFQSPWQHIDESSSERKALESELAREVTEGHQLYKHDVRAIARRLDNDEVLFAVTAPRTCFAVVHLAWSGCESDPDWPATEIFSSLTQFAEERMIRDAKELA
ncbi:MAG: hypothetical protein RL326_1196 [Pseudomonadota bacterium]